MIKEIIESKVLTYEQKVLSLARCGENSINPIDITDEGKNFIKAGVICGLNEGNAPYRPRYVVPNYEKFLKNGSKFLELEPSNNLDDVLNNLLIFYRHVPSITSFPVYIGNLDYLLDPFIKNEEEDYLKIKRFFIHIDRTITDSFCHGNIGPGETLAGKLILRAQRELMTSIPNLTLKLSLDTPEDFLIDAVNTCLLTAKPSFANDEIFRKDFGGDYAIASCYNGLYIGGGSYTLTRINLKKLSDLASSEENFIKELIPNAVKEMIKYIDDRIKFIVEESNFFESSFLVKEGLIDINNFTAMFGLVGLAEAVNKFYSKGKLESKFGYNDLANEFGENIIRTIDDILKEHTSKYCYGTDKKIILHAQVGIDTDLDSSPGCRIPIGEEPELYEHIIQSARYHKYFPSGIGDVFNFDFTVKNNPSYLVDIIRGAFKHNLRYFSAYSSDSDLVRITGYLVKRSEIEKYKNQKQVLRDTVALGYGADEKQHALSRKLRK